jgi:hypothetical protein
MEWLMFWWVILRLPWFLWVVLYVRIDRDIEESGELEEDWL